MIDWSTLQFAHLWPFGLLFVVCLLLYLHWRFDQRFWFPDIRLIKATRPVGGLFEVGAIGTGIGLLILLALILAKVSVVRIETVEQRARDFLIIVDTSRSMRHDTEVRRDDFDVNFERKVGAFASRVDDPQSIPFIARYELARESLLSFLQDRGAEDRVGLMYFNDDTHPVSALTSDISFVTQQLASMDQYVNWGTNIAAAMQSGLDLLSRYEDQNKRAVILLTDAETRFTAELEQQLARIAKEQLSFYLLWITTDEDQESDDAINSFLSQARAVGTVFAINDLSSDSLHSVFSDIGHMENYDYQETRRHSLDLSASFWRVSRVVFLLWLTLMLTLLHPPLKSREMTESYL